MERTLFGEDSSVEEEEEDSSEDEQSGASANGEQQVGAKWSHKSRMQRSKSSRSQAIGHSHVSVCIHIDMLILLWKRLNGSLCRRSDI